MRHRRGTYLAAAVLLLLGASAARAAEPRPEVALEGQLGYLHEAASKTATASFGSANAFLMGGALRATVWRGAFVSLAFRTFSRDGERVFVATPDSPVQKLGFPLSMRTSYFLPSVGYRFRNGHLIVPYASIGLAITSYHEQSEVAGQPYELDVRKTGFTAAAGVELGRSLLRFGAELGYTSAGALGTTGVSKVYGETDAGGFYAVGKVVLAFGI